VIYPNPSGREEAIHIKVITPVAQTMQVQLVDMTGRQLFTRNDIRCKVGENLISLNSLSFLKQGIYILKVRNQDGPAFFETKVIQRLER